MKIIDLSQTVSETSLFYPGDIQAGADFRLKKIESMEEGGNVNSEAVTAGVHVLTHLDSPGHQVKGGKLIQEYPLEKFIQEALIVEVLDRKEIAKKDLEPYQKEIEKVGALLVRTGFDEVMEHYEQDAAFRQKTKIDIQDLPQFTQDCADWLAKFANLEIVGTDSLTVGGKQVHGTFLKKDILLLEGLFLAKAPKKFVLHCFPWKLNKVNGAPCRAVALI